MTIRPYPPVNVGIVGFGYWGPRLLRNFNNAETTRVVALCERDARIRTRLFNEDMRLPVLASLDEMLALKDLEAVAIATPPSAHFELTRQALDAGKHVFVEKPFTRSSEEAKSLLRLARERDRRIAVDHTYLFTPAVQKLRDVVRSGELGQLLYYDSIRINLGLFQSDVDVIWDLAPHDFSVLSYVMPARARSVSVIGASHTPTGMSDVAYVTLDFGNGLLAHMHLNWLAPVKVRQVLVGGAQRMVQWDDVNPDEKIRIYDRGIEYQAREELTVSPDDPEGRYQGMISYRSGDVLSPWLPRTEALYSECAEFGRVVRGEGRLRSDGRLGLEVVLMLEAASRSAQKGGAFEPIEWGSLEEFERSDEASDP